jgi:hypothetical protein
MIFDILNLNSSLNALFSNEFIMASESAMILKGCLKFDQQILFVWSAKLFFWSAICLFF